MSTLEWSVVKPMCKAVINGGAKQVPLKAVDGRSIGTAHELGGGIALIVLKDEDVLHRHQGFTETYIPLNDGLMRLGDKVFPVTPGRGYEVPRDTWHACAPPTGMLMVFWCVSRPEFDPEDLEAHPDLALGWSSS